MLLKTLNLDADTDLGPVANNTKRKEKNQSPDVRQLVAAHVKLGCSRKQWIVVFIQTTTGKIQLSSLCMICTVPSKASPSMF